MNFDNIKNSIRILPSKQLKEYLGRSDVLIFDLRDKKDYDAEHIPGAVWIDIDLLEKDIRRIYQEVMRQMRTGRFLIKRVSDLLFFIVIKEIRV